MKKLLLLCSLFCSQILAATAPVLTNRQSGKAWSTVTGGNIQSLPTMGIYNGITLLPTTVDVDGKLSLSAVSFSGTPATIKTNAQTGQAWIQLSVGNIQASPMLGVYNGTTLKPIAVDEFGNVETTGGGGSGANTALSNLTSPTAINQSLLFGANATYDLGSGSDVPRRVYFGQIWNAAGEFAEGHTLTDATGAQSIQIIDRELYDSDEGLSIGYDARQLYDASENAKFDWSSADLNALTHKIINVVDPAGAQDAATMNYVDIQNTPTTSAISSTAIDWAILKKSGGLYTKTLGANTTFTFSNLAAGETIVVRLTNTASNYTVTWPTVKWPGGSTPVMTTGAKSDIYTFIYDGTDVFGSGVQNF